MSFPAYIFIPDGEKGILYSLRIGWGIHNRFDIIEIFSGNKNQKIKIPFVLKVGKKWYKNEDGELKECSFEEGIEFLEKYSGKNWGIKVKNYLMLQRNKTKTTHGLFGEMKERIKAPKEIVFLKDFNPKVNNINEVRKQLFQIIKNPEKYVLKKGSIAGFDNKKTSRKKEKESQLEIQFDFAYKRKRKGNNSPNERRVGTGNRRNTGGRRNITRRRPR